MTNFKDSIFENEGNFSASKFRGKIIFADCAFRFALFDATEFNGNVNFEWSEFCGYAGFEDSKFSGDRLTFKNAKFYRPEFQENACRRAKNLLEKAGDREEAGYHFYREMEGKRKQKPWFIRYPEWMLIQFVFGYGVHPMRLWTCWIVFVFLFAAIYSLGHGIDAAASQLQRDATLKDYIWFSIATAITPGYAGYKPTTDFKLVAGLEAIFGTFMWAAFIATFTRKYMR